MRNPAVARRSCLARNHEWRRQAGVLRDHARGSHLSEPQRDQLRREAEAADRMADEWLIAAIEDR